MAPVPEIDVPEDLVRALLRAQHPDLADLPLRDAGAGWDNRMWRLGTQLAVRLPVRSASAPLVEHEQQCLPVLGHRLPVAAPVPVRVGRPGSGFPWSWSVVPWFDGVVAAQTSVRDRGRWATALAEVLVALHQPAPADAPVNPFRGVSLHTRDDAVRARGGRIRHPLADAALDAWRDALSAPAWSGPPLWLHGDPHPGNLLVRDGRLVALLDFGDVTGGDPASDLATAWLTFDAAGRRAFRDRVDAAGVVDAATWQRARGWAAAICLALLDHAVEQPQTARMAEHGLAELADERGAASIAIDPADREA